MKRKKNCMSRILVLLMSVLMIAAFTSCGGTDGGDTTKDEGPKAEYWVLSGLDIGTGMEDAETAAEFFQMEADEIMSLKISDDGTAGVILYKEYGTGTWTETDKGLDIVVGEGNEDSQTITFVRDDNDNLVYSEESDGVTVTMQLSRSESVPAAFVNNALANLDVNFSAEETLKMSNLMLGGEFACEDGVIYCHGFDKDGKPITLSFAFDSSKEKDSRISDVKYLDEDFWASYINLKDGSIYYIASDTDGNSQVCRMNEDGSDRTVLYDKNASYLQVDGDKIYFTDENHRLVSADLDGGSLTTVIDKEVYYTYHLGGDWFVFQDDADGESLHLANTAMGYDERLSEGKVYSCVADGSYLYYVDITDEENNVGNLVRLDLKTLKSERSDCLMYNEICISSTHIQGVLRDIKVEKDKWNELENAHEKNEDCYFTKYFSDDIRIYWYQNADGIIEQLAIDTSDGAFTAVGPRM
ncbi:MAG: DUF5050 domain-containing protein [Emergencia sp.]